jgi:dTMP kinase
MPESASTLARFTFHAQSTHFKPSQPKSMEVRKTWNFRSKIAFGFSRAILPMAMKTFAELNFPGRLIAVEGLDGSGKSTQIYLLKRWLELQGLKVYFSEWNSSELVKTATSKGKKRELLTPTTFSLIHATDFADRYERHLVPLLRAGYLVLCDRYIFTAFGRDVVRGCPPEWVRGLYNFAALPDLTFFFKADLEVSLQRILDGRPQLKYFEAGMDLRLSTDPYESFRIFQGRILEQYLAMSTEFKFLVIDANQLVEAQQATVRELVTQRLDLAAFRRAERAPMKPPRDPHRRSRFTEALE